MIANYIEDRFLDEVLDRDEYSFPMNYPVYKFDLIINNHFLARK